MSEPTAREKFVEAMRGLNEDTYANDTENAAALMQQAVDAFADAECRSGGDAATCHLATDGSLEQHAACRVALRKECGV